MAIINNNVQNVKFLRNQNPFKSREDARQALENNKAQAADGTALLARYTVSGTVKTIVGFVYVTGSTHDITIFDTEGASGDVEELRREINAKLGTTFISSGNTVEANLTALSGGTFVPGTSSSANTSVEGAKAYAYNLLGTLDYEDTAVPSQYVSQVTQADGKIAVTRVELPSSADTAVAKKFVTSVAEDKGQIVVSRGEISSSAETMVLTDNADGGVNFEVNIDGASIVQDPTSKKIKVADSALTQYFGDEKTIHAEVDTTTNKKTFNTLLKIVKNTSPSETEVKEEYYLADVDGTAITGADTIKIYKDSHIVSITYITDSGDTHYQNLEYKYIDASGATKTEYVDISSLVLEAEFASGVTITNHVAHGVVDSTSETFLTVGANGFKLAGVQDAIDAAVEDLDATVSNSGNSGHVGVEIVEENGKLISVTVSEDDIASADDLEGLSAKTITDVKSVNGSVTVTPGNAADGTKEIDLATDADKILMSGFSADNASALSGIATSDSIATAFEKTNTVITENERVIAAALTDLDDRIETVSGDVETLSAKTITSVTVNNNAVTVANGVAPISITAATSAATATSTEAIVVNTDANGNITLGIANIDCGYYDGTV
jgi:hypothetical protein